MTEALWEKYAVGAMEWCSLEERDKPRFTFGTTAYRECAGIDDLFSVWIEVPNHQSEHQQLVVNNVVVKALARAMEERLPDRGEKLIITDGFAPIASFTCHAVKRFDSTAV